MIKRIGKRTLALENRPYLLGHAAAVGKKEGEDVTIAVPDGMRTLKVLSITKD